MPELRLAPITALAGIACCFGTAVAVLGLDDAVELARRHIDRGFGQALR